MAFHDFIRDTDGWHTHGREELFSNKYLAVYQETVASPTRPAPFTWTLCHRKAAVVVAPMTADGKLVLVRQERVPIRQTIWEFPAGQIDDHAEPEAIRDTGLRELREEAGYELAPGGELFSLGHFFPSCGFTDEHSHLLFASPVLLHADGAEPDDSESITECRAFSVDEFREMIATGIVNDANTLAAFARLVALGIL